jgi:hypothetical protein
MGAALEVVAEADVKKIALMNDRFDELSQTVRNKVVSGLLSAAEATEKLGVVLAAVWAVRNEPELGGVCGGDRCCGGGVFAD